MCMKCQHGWIAVGENRFEMCDCPLGEAMRRPQSVLIVYGRRVGESEEDTKLKECMAWYERKMGRVT